MYSPVPHVGEGLDMVGSDEDSGDFSLGDSDSDSDDDSGSEEVEEVSPPPAEGRSKTKNDPAPGRGQAGGSAAKGAKRSRTNTPEPTERVAKQPKVPVSKPRKALPRIIAVVPIVSAAAISVTSPGREDESVEKDTPDAATSRMEPMDVDPPAPPSTELIVAPTPTVVEPASPPPAPVVQAPAPEAPVLQITPPGPSQTIFTLHRTPEDQTGAAKEAMIQAEFMMLRTKEAYEASKLAYDASSALRANVQKSCELGTRYADLEKEKAKLQLDLELAQRNLERAQTDLRASGDIMKKALEDKDQALADAQKTAREKTDAAEKKLAAVKAIEEENTKLKQERADWVKKLEHAIKRAKGLESFIGDYAQKMYSLLEDFCKDFEKETETIEPSLDPTKSLVGDAAAMNMLRLEARLDGVKEYVARLRSALAQIDKELWPEDSLRADLESMMTRLEALPDRVQVWKKSAARCGADVALSLVRVHCKEVKEKLKALQVANTRKLQFEDFMETFIEAATRIADGIDLNTFVEPASPPDA